MREVLLDVSGLGRLIGEPSRDRVGTGARAHGHGIAGGVAIAPTQTSARLLARAAADADPSADPARFVTADAAAAIRSQPVVRLQAIEAVPPAMSVRDRARPYETFERWGIRTLDELAALPAADLSSRLGRRGQALQRLARGLDPRPFVPDAATPRFLERLELEWPIDELEPLSFIFARLLDPLSTALERADRGAAALRLDLRLVDRSTHTRVLQLPVADARPAGAAHAAAARSRIASSRRGHRHRRDRARSGARAHHAVLAARSRAAVGRSALDLDGAVVGAGRRDALGTAVARGQPSAGRVRDAELRDRRHAVRAGSTGCGEWGSARPPAAAPSPRHPRDGRAADARYMSPPRVAVSPVDPSCSPPDRGEHRADGGRVWRATSWNRDEWDVESDTAVPVSDGIYDHGSSATASTGSTVL